MQKTLEDNPLEFLLPSESEKDKQTCWDDVYPIIASNNRIDIYISDNIVAPYEFNRMIHTLNSATAQDQVIIHLNTPGGYIDSANMLCDAMSKCAAPIHCILTGMVASAGTVITMFADTIEVADGCSFMIHNYSAGISGKGHEIKAHQRFMDDELNKYFTKTYDGFLTSKEIKDVIGGKDLWMGKDEVLARWENHLAALAGEPITPIPTTTRSRTRSSAA